LSYASRHVTAIEINGTFYRTQARASFRKWHDETPADFVFSLKGPRFLTHRRELASAAPFMERFFASGFLELGAKLGPILWQFTPTLAFDAAVRSAMSSRCATTASAAPNSSTCCAGAISRSRWSMTRNIRALPS
jgi:uncharacterized protein YecE (DUF72 family)